MRRLGIPVSIHRSAACVMAWLVFWQQCALAAETPERTLELVQPSAILSPSELLARQSALEAEVDLKNSLMTAGDPSDPVTAHGARYDRSVARLDGWTYYYMGKLVVERAHTDGRAYLYAYSPSGRNIRTVYYKQGGSYQSTTNYRYDGSDAYQGKAVSYANGSADEYDALNTRTRHVNADGSSVVYRYTAQKSVASLTKYAASGSFVSETVYEYGALGARTAWHIRYANGTTQYYDAAGLRIKYLQASGAYTLYSYHPDRRLATATAFAAGGALVSTTTYLYDAALAREGRLVSYADGRVYEYDAAGRLVRRTARSWNGLWMTAAFTYHGSSTIVRERRCYAHDGTLAMTCSFDERGALASAILGNGTRYGYGDGVLLTISGPDGDVWAGGKADALVVPAGGLQAYDAAQRLARSINPDGSCDEYRYGPDQALSIRRTYYPDGSIIERDAAGTVTWTFAPHAFAPPAPDAVSVTTADGTAVWYSAQGAIDRAVLPDGTVIDGIGLGPDGALVSCRMRLPEGTVAVVRDGETVQTTSAGGVITRYADGRVGTVYTPGEGLSAYSYDAQAGSTVVRSAGRYVRYDAEGRLSMVVYDDGRSASYASGVLQVATDSSGNMYSYVAGPAAAGVNVKLLTVIDARGTELKAASAGLDRTMLSRIVRGADGKTVSAVRIDGMRLADGDGGLSVSGPVNASLSFQVLPDAGGVMAVIRDGLTRTYDAAGMLSSIATAEGTVFSFAGGRVESAVAGGVTYRDIRLGADGQIAGYEALDASGERTVYRDGAAVKRFLTDGTTITYSAGGRVDSIENADGKLYRYRYEIDADGAIARTIKELVRCPLPGGIVLELDAGGVVRVLTANGGVIASPVFDSRWHLTAGALALDDLTGTIVDGALLTLVVPLPDGVATLRYAEGMLRESTGPGGHYWYEYLFDEAGAVRAVLATDAASTREYDPDGSLTSLADDGCTVRYGPDGEIAAIESRDGSFSIARPLYDQAGKLTGGAITYSDGAVYEISEGKLVTVTAYDGSTRGYGADGCIAFWTGAGWRCDYEYERNDAGAIVRAWVVRQQGASTIRAEIPVTSIPVTRPSDIAWKDSLLPDARRLPEYLCAPADPSFVGYIHAERYYADLDICAFADATPMRIEYDAAGNLRSIVRTNGSELRFESAKPSTMIEPDGSEVTYGYSGPSLGRATLFPSAPGAPEVVLEYAADRIRRAISGGTTYAYAYDDAIPGGRVRITDESSGDIFCYDGLALTSLTQPNGLVTSYYYEGKQMSRSVVTLNGVVTDTFCYDRCDDLTVVTDEKRTRRTYDANGRLIYLETPEGLGYRHTYTDDGNGNDVLEVELDRAVCEDGIVIYHKDGNIDHIRLKDGTVITVKDSASPSSLKNMTIRDGLVDVVTYETGETATYIRDGRGDLQEIVVEKDGIARRYSPEGELIELRKGPTERYLFGYTRLPNGAADKIKVTKVVAREIGAAVPPIDLAVYSAGYYDGWDATVLSGDRAVGSFNVNWQWVRNNEPWNGRGYDVAVIDDVTGRVVKSSLFDLCAKGQSEADRLAAFIDTVETGDFVLMAIGDDGYTSLNENAKRAIRSIGSTMIDSVRYRDSWAIIGRKGAAAGTVLEGYSPVSAGPVSLSAWTAEEYYYDADGTMLPLDRFRGTLDSGWRSMRPTTCANGITPLSVNGKGQACGYIKSFSPLYPDAGFMRVWDTTEAVNAFDRTRSDELLAVIGPKTKKAVYYDPRYPTRATGRSFSAGLVSYLSERGYEVLDADAARAWLEANGPDSVLIMGQDVAPSTIINTRTADSPVHDYLQNGGTFVWMHDVPFYYVGYADGTAYELGEIGQKRILGVVTALEDRHGDKYAEVIGECAIPAFTVPAGQETLDPGIIHFDISVNYRDIDWHKVRASIGYDLHPDTAVTSVYDAEGSLVSVAKADRTVVYYEGGKVDFIVDLHGDTITDHTYDAEGNITAVTMTRSRRDLDYTIGDARAKIALEEARQLEELALQQGLITQDIRAYYRASVDGLLAQRAALYAQLDAINNESDGWFGWNKKSKNARRDQCYYAIGTVNNHIALAARQEAEQLSALSGQIDDARRQIEESADRSFAQIEQERLRLLNEIVVEEARPVIYEYYRQILGRDPGADEVRRWTDTVDVPAGRSFDAALLKAELSGSSERAGWEASAGRIRSAVGSKLDRYLAAGPDEREAFLAALGLRPEEAAAIGAGDVELILGWLAAQNVHFGRSAAAVIGRMLEGTACDWEAERVIEEAILVDILTGSIGKFSSGDLLISSYAIAKVARLYGVELTPAVVTFDGLRGLVLASETPVFINGNHYAMVTAIDAETGAVTYYESSRGINGELVTVGREQFLASWSERVALARGRPEAGVAMTDYAAKKIRGACLGFVIFAIAAVFSAAFTVVEAIAVAVVAIVQTVVVPVIQLALAAVVSFFQNVVSSAYLIGKSLFTGLGSIGASIFRGFASPLAGFGSAFALGTALGGSPIAGAGFIAAATKSVVGIALSYGVNAGLEALGVAPAISRSIGAFVTGGILGAFGSAHRFFNFGEALGAFAGTGLGGLSEHLPLPGPIAGLARITATVTLDGLWRGAEIGGVLTSIAPTVIAELSYIGVQRFGELIGLDPRFANVAGVGIRGIVNSGLAQSGNLAIIWQGIQNGLLQGAIRLGMNYAVQEFGLNPLVVTAGMSMISTAINAGVNAVFNVENDFLGSIFRTYENNVLTLAGYGESPKRNDPRFWTAVNGHMEFNASAYESAMEYYGTLQAIYFGSIGGIATKLAGNNFDFEKVITDCALTFFGATITDAIQGLGVTVGNYFATMLANNAFAWKTSSAGAQYAEVDVEDAQGNKIGAGRFEHVTEGNGATYWKIIGKLERESDGSETSSFGEVGFDRYGKAGYTDAEIERIYYGLWRERQYIRHGQQTYADVTDLRDGTTLISITPPSSGGYVVYSGEGHYVGASIETDQGYSIEYSGADAFDYRGSRLVMDDPVALNSYIRQVAPIGFDPDDFIFRIRKENDSYNISVGLVDPAAGLSPELHATFANLAKYVNNLWLSTDYFQVSASAESTIKSYGNNVSSVLDPSRGYRTKEVHYNGLHFIGDTVDDVEIVHSGRDVSAALGYTRIKDGQIRYDIDPYTKNSIIVRIENYIPVSIAYDGRAAASVVRYTAENDLEIMGRYVITIIGDRPVDFSDKNEEMISHRPVNYDTLIALLTEIQVPHYQLSLPGIYNSEPDNPELEYVAAMQEIFDARNKFDPQLVQMLNEATFCNSDAVSNFYDLLFNPAKRWDTIRDPLAVLLNPVFGHLIAEARKKFDKNFDPLWGLSFIMESGGKAPAIGCINRDGLRSYANISISGNFSERFINPYAKFFVNFTTNNEVTDMYDPIRAATIPFITEVYDSGDIFFSPGFDKQVWNIQFDDDELNLARDPDKQYMHVDYARKPAHDYHDMFIDLSGFAEYAVIDGGVRFKDALMAMLQVDSNGLMQHIIDNDGKIVLGKASAERWNKIKNAF